MADKVVFKPVETREELEALARLAAEIWMDYWPALIGEEQTRYMVEMFHSVEAMERDRAEHGYEYWFIQSETGDVLGYTAGHDEPESGRYYISKVYLKPEVRGRHLATCTFAFFDELCRKRGWHAMYLNVNKGNELGAARVPRQRLPGDRRGGKRHRQRVCDGRLRDGAARLRVGAAHPERFHGAARYEGRPSVAYVLFLVRTGR